MAKWDDDTFRRNIKYKNRYTVAEVKVANFTCRYTGCFGQKAIVPRLVLEMVKPGQTVLDYGAGIKAIHLQKFRDKGIDITAHDFGRNFTEGIHDPDALDYQYDIVYASNVLNVQSTPRMLDGTLLEWYDLIDENGYIVANYTQTPRKMPQLQGDQLRKIIDDLFGYTEIIHGYSARPVWKIMKIK